MKVLGGNQYTNTLLRYDSSGNFITSSSPIFSSNYSPNKIIGNKITVSGDTLKSNYISTFYNWVSLPGYVTVGTDSVFIPSVMAYYACISNTTYGACLDTSEIVYVIPTSTIDIDKKFQIYPNPVTDILQIHSTDKINSVELLSITGNRIYSKSENSNDISIDMASFSEGMYFLRINNSLLTKIVKN